MAAYLVAHPGVAGDGRMHAVHELAGGETLVRWALPAMFGCACTHLSLLALAARQRDLTVDVLSGWPKPRCNGAHRPQSSPLRLAFAIGCGSDVGGGIDVGSSGGTSAGVASMSGGSAESARGGASGNDVSGGGAGANSGGVGGSSPSVAGKGGTSTGRRRSQGGSGLGGGGGAGGSAGGAGVGGSPAASGAGGGGGSGGSASVFPPNCKCLGMGPPACVPTGNVTFTLARSASPSADEQKAYDDITCAMTGAVAYYNCNTTITKALNVSYVPSVATADGNYNGSIRFGSDHSYMECATGMHEIAHTVGVGTAPNWPKVSTGGLFTGENAIAQLRVITGVADDVLHSDTQHFWPYGLNYASEAKSTADLLDHCLMVTAIRKDLGL